MANIDTLTGQDLINYLESTTGVPASTFGDLSTKSDEYLRSLIQLMADIGNRIPGANDRGIHSDLPFVRRIAYAYALGYGSQGLPANMTEPQAAEAYRLLQNPPTPTPTPTATSTARFASGTPVVGSTDPRTVQQNAFISANTVGSTSLLRPELRAKALTPTGQVVDASQITIPSGRETEIQNVLAAGTDITKPSGGYMLMLNTDGIPIQYVGVYPSAEVLAAIARYPDNNPTKQFFISAGILSPSGAVTSTSTTGTTGTSTSVNATSSKTSTENTFPPTTNTGNIPAEIKSLSDYIYTELQKEFADIKDRVSYPASKYNRNLSDNLAAGIVNWLETVYLPRILNYLGSKTWYTDYETIVINPTDLATEFSSGGVGDHSHGIVPNPHTHSNPLHRHALHFYISGSSTQQ